MRTGVRGGGLGCEAHRRVCVSLVGLRPARARVFSGG